MKSRLLSFLVLLVFAAQVSLAADGLSLRDITGGKYHAKGIRQVTPLKDGETYTQLSGDGKRIECYSFKTGKQVSTLFDVTTARNKKLENIDGYIMSPDETKILIQTQTKWIYRHSFTAEYYIFSVRNNTLAPLSENGAQQQPIFSPDGNYIAFARQNNLFIVKLLFDNSESQVTKDGKYNEVINGLPDWVNEEEFSTSRSFAFSADSKMLAWVRYDESQVPLYSFPIYHMPQAGEAVAANPSNYTYKYPLAGGINSRVSVHSFDIKANVTRKIAVPLDDESYVPRLLATNTPDQFIVFTLNRRQDRMDVYAADARSTVCKLVMREEADKYISEPAYTAALVADNLLVLPSDKSGFMQIYAYPIVGGTGKQLTNEKAGVKNILSYSTTTKQIFYQAQDEGPLRTFVAVTDLTGKTRRLTDVKGNNSAIVSANGAYFIHTHSDFNNPPKITLRSTAGKTLATLVDNTELKTKLADKLGQKEFFTFTTPDGILLNGWMVKPRNFDASKRYPVIMYQYSGPGSQEVKDEWGNGFYGGLLIESYWAQEGFVVVCVDGRGTGGRGAEFQKCTYLRLGVLESEDQVHAARHLATLPYVDAARMAIWGWSFGGFNTLMSMSDGNAIFKAGVAVAAPSTWKFYDTVYTERFMRKPQENGSGYEESPLSRAKKLSGNLLLMHGTADDNVHFSNATVYAEALVQADKQFDMQVYTNKNHSIYGGNTRYQLITRMTDFFKKHLK